MEQAARIRVLVADDHALVRAGIVSLLRALPKMEIVGEAGDGAEAVALATRLLPDVVVLDISMKGMDGFAAAEQIRAASPQVRIVMLSMHTDRGFVERALAAGAAAYLIKDSATAELELAVSSVLRGDTYLSAGLMRGVVDDLLRKGAGRTADQPLTSRQREVLRLMAEGKGTKEIAHLLGLSPKTVESHRAQIQERLGIRDLAGLIRYAMRTGLTLPHN